MLKELDSAHSLNFQRYQPQLITVVVRRSADMHDAAHSGLYRIIKSQVSAIYATYFVSC